MGNFAVFASTTLHHLDIWPLCNILMMQIHIRNILIFTLLTGVLLTQLHIVCGFTSDNLENEDDVPGEPLSPLDFSNAEKLPIQTVTHTTSANLFGEDPTEKAGLFEGDILLNGYDEFDDQKDMNAKNAIKNKNEMWANGIIPYLISSKFNEHDRSVIARAVLEFHRRTCITFSPRRTEKDFVLITSGQGCSSPVGRTGGSQQVTLGSGCVYPGIVMHEFMHTIGFWHEQSRWDRDDHVVVFYENIQPGTEENFRKISWKETQNLTVAYDTSSIMHYGPYAFSKNRQRRYKTIAPKIPNDNMGQRSNFSESDVLKINKLYNCNRKPDQETTTESNANNSPGDSEQCVDNHHNCQKWANNGECQKNPNWMLVNCSKSCNQCRSCSNSNKNCDAWAASGECSKNPGYMNSYCQKSCKQCP